MTRAPRETGSKDGGNSGEGRPGKHAFSVPSLCLWEDELGRVTGWSLQRALHVHSWREESAQEPRMLARVETGPGKRDGGKDEEALSVGSGLRRAWVLFYKLRVYLECHGGATEGLEASGGAKRWE